MMDNYLARRANIVLLQALYDAASTKCVKTLRDGRSVDQVSSTYTASNKRIELS